MGENTNKAKGKAKQAAGKLAGDDKLAREGRRDENRGKLAGAGRDLKGAAKDAKKDVKKQAR